MKKSHNNAEHLYAEIRMPEVLANARLKIGARSVTKTIDVCFDTRQWDLIR